MMIASGSAPLTAVLGPTNTGKTHLAIERMLAHASGMIGLPLRLLAREVYDKVVKVKGERACALITGEEKIAPESARYFVCTVEAMPLERRVEFLAVDEIQLAADADRGHVFTDRILRARGLGETMLLGADTMRPMLKRLEVPCEVQRRERLSTLAYAGHKKLTKLPKRSAIVAFSSEEVYAIAELMRRQRGGAAVIMGALSPRTRNAQAALYQSGEVDFLVATDAIGMGLNMDVDHVAFAGRFKFDGRRTRGLRPDEVAQIAGRAGRFRADGAFGETGSCPPFDEETIARVESHEFESVEAIEWRNPALNFSSVRELLRSLEQPPSEPGLVRSRGASDEESLRRLALAPELMDMIARPADVRRLWEVCLTPDFRKVTIDEHARLVHALAMHLLGPSQRLPQDWIAREIEKLDRTEGDIDALQSRLAHIRTWTYAANRPDWIDDCEHWRLRTRDIEDRLSDRLHDLLTLRFIDRRTSALIRGLRKEELIEAAVSPDGEVQVEGHFVGRLEGLAFKPDPRAIDPREARAVKSAAQRALAPEVSRRLREIANAAAPAFALEASGRILWNHAAIARIAAGSPLLRPRVALIGAETAEPLLTDAAAARLEAYLAALIQARLAPLLNLQAALDRGELKGAARGLAFLLLEQAGAQDAREAAGSLAVLTKLERAQLRTLGVRFGRCTLSVAGLDKPQVRRLLAILWHYTGQKPNGRLFLAPRKALSAPRQDGFSFADYAAGGFRPAGSLAVKIEALERFAAAARGPEFALTPELAALLGQPPELLAPALEALGYRRRELMWRAPKPPRLRPAPAAASDNPFAALAGLVPQAPASRPRPRRKKRREPANER